MKRLFDIFWAVMGILVAAPFFILFAVLIFLGDGKNPFFNQVRVGKDCREFRLIKFRSMRVGAEKSGQITVGGKDSRITRIGYFLRKYKLDELPQFINILAGDMSFVGPRPEVPKYVALYSPEQQKVLSVRPGLTDLASLEFIDENILLGHAKDAEATYINEVLPKKLALQLQYVQTQSMLGDVKLIFRTLVKIVR
ncbi:MAG: sugar transferase [Cryomorphaceae bacterium]|nr:sugar transferase [Cryomorphaceae bacterium]